MSITLRINITRLLIGIVFFWNVQCAILFLLMPGNYAPSFELSGDLGEAMIRAMGVLFLMWNVPYAFALWHPVRNKLSLFEAMIMQSIGFIGELVILFHLPVIHTTARFSILRFSLFDGLGVLLLFVAFLLVHGMLKQQVDQQK